MLPATQAALLPSSGAGAPARKGGKVARAALVSVALAASATFGLYAASSHEDTVLRAKNILSMYGWEFGFRKYKQVQYFGFNLFTAPGNSVDGCFGSHEDDGDCHLGSPGVAADISQRANIILKAIYTAHAQENVDNRNDTLKIFLAPEWYWTGPRGAYRIDYGDGYTNGNAIKMAMATLMDKLSQPMFEHWVFVLGTFVMGVADAEKPLKTFEKTAYYNFAPIHVGGTDQAYIAFKHHITRADWLQGFVDKDEQQSTIDYCAEHRAACRFRHPEPDMLESLGFGKHKPVKGSRFDVGGIAVGIEIDHDHENGKLLAALDSSQSVDVHLIVSQGMTIAMGPVCTRTGGPIFLCDGSARTEMSLNQYGAGRKPARMPNGKLRYGLGVAYGADSLVAFQQWLGDMIVLYTHQAWGPRAPGEGTLAGGSEVDGQTGVTFSRVLALGQDWRKVVDGYYRTISYDKAQQVYEDCRSSEMVVERQSNGTWVRDAEVPILAPTIDIYGPLLLVDTDRLY